MKGKPGIIDGLSEVLTAELTAINQYFVHHAMAENWGYDLLAKAVKQEALAEMKHAEMLIERLLFYDARPNMQKYSRINIGEDVPDFLKKDLDLELDAVERLNRLIEEFQKAGDFGAAQLLMQILSDEEEHVDWLETQLGLIASLGLENYLTRYVSASSGE
ncbi:MAG: bacterioferritin [Planctomycetota bacterium]